MKRNLFAASLVLAALAVTAPKPARAAETDLIVTPSAYGSNFIFVYAVKCKMDTTGPKWDQTRYILSWTGADITRNNAPFMYTGGGVWHGPQYHTFSDFPAGSYTCSAYAIGSSANHSPSWNQFSGNKFVTVP